MSVLFGSGNIDTFGIKLLYQNEASEYLGRYCKYQNWGFWKRWVINAFVWPRLDLQSESNNKPNYMSLI